MTTYVFHLVHGTWARGLRGKPMKLKSIWTDLNSDFCVNVRKLVPGQVTFSQFNWSGQNSFEARALAARDFTVYLTDAIRKAPKANHIVISHSHGGTVVMHALAAMDLDGKECPVKHAIFLSTPFAYLYQRKSDTMANSLGALVAGFFTLALGSSLHGFESTDFLPAVQWASFIAILGTAITVLVSSITSFWANRKPAFGFGYVMEKPFPKSIPVTVLRGSRDEASLAIGLSQAFHSLGEILITLGAELHLRRLSIFMAIAVLFATFLGVPGMFLGFGVGFLGYWLYCWVLGAPVFAVLGRYDIEADVTPPNMVCRVISFNMLESLFIRHSIYDTIDVHLAVAEIVNAITRDAEPPVSDAKNLRRTRQSSRRALVRRR